MFLSNSLQPGTPRKCFAQSALALCFLLCLPASFSLIGCKMDAKDDEVVIQLDPRLIGAFKADYGDEYEITSAHLTYTTQDYFDPDNYIIWGGEIVYAANFSANAGILIIRYDSDKKKKWTDWNDMSDITPMDKDFFGIYFEDLSQAGVRLSETSDQANNWGPSETATLQEAINRFTLDNMYDWIASGVTPMYSRQ